MSIGERADPSGECTLLVWMGSYHLCYLITTLATHAKTTGLSGLRPRHSLTGGYLVRCLFRQTQYVLVHIIVVLLVWCMKQCSHTQHSVLPHFLRIYVKMKLAIFATLVTAAAAFFGTPMKRAVSFHSRSYIMFSRSRISRFRLVHFSSRRARSSA